MDDIVRLARGGSEALIAVRGAEPIAWRVDGHDLLWTPDPAVWDRTSPVLFPIVGRVRDRTLRVDGRPYPMEIHGFAPASRFAVVEAGGDSVLMRLVDDDATRARYPFAFRLDIRYRLEPDGLSVGFEVASTGEAELPYALGFHPGFVWPLPGNFRAGHRVVFDEPERPEVPVITADGLFGAARRRIPLDGRTLALDDEVMSHEALCFLDASSRAVEYVAPDGSILRIEADDFPHWALWTKPPAPYLCIENWTGHGDPDGYAGDLAGKPSMRLLAPGMSARHAVRMRFTRAVPSG